MPHGLANWCPICSFSAAQGAEGKAICPGCHGNASVACSRCLCLECGGTSKVPCPDCAQGRVPCPHCNGEGYRRLLLVRPVCDACLGTGNTYHEACEGTGRIPCSSCAGIGHLPDCPACGSTGRIACPVCVGTGLSPTSDLVEHARSGPLIRLIQHLPVLQEAPAGELVDLDAALRRVIAFLGIHHWIPLVRADERQHELVVLPTKLHLQHSVLTVRRHNDIRILYHFLNVARTADDSFRVEYLCTEKEWR